MPRVIPQKAGTLGTVATGAWRGGEGSAPFFSEHDHHSSRQRQVNGLPRPGFHLDNKRRLIGRRVRMGIGGPGDGPGLVRSSLRSGGGQLMTTRFLPTIAPGLSVTAVSV